MSLSTATEFTKASAGKFLTKRSISASRSSSIRKLAKYAAIYEGVRPLIMPVPTRTTLNGSKLKLHPTRGWQRV
jgi:hypothetical protein